MSREINRIHQLLIKKGVAFVIYSLPKTTDYQLHISYKPKKFHNLDFLTSNNDKGFVFAPFDVDSKYPIWFLESDKIIDESSDLYSIEKYLESLPDSKSKAKDSINSTTKEEYSIAFDKYKAALDSKQIDKVILSKIVSIEGCNLSLFELFNRMLTTYPKAFTYFIHLPNGETWMGASPEVLINHNEKGINTMALAGTQIIGDQKINKIVWESKEIEEQAYVKEYISEVLSTFTKKVNCSETYTSQAGNLAHLRTDITVNQIFDRSMIVEIIKRLHPTPAICGIPLESSRKLILNTENHNRAYYTGFLGPISSNSMSLFVNLRCMQILQDKFALYVGGGITRNSELEKEWLEAEAKANTLLSVIYS